MVKKLITPLLVLVLLFILIFPFHAVARAFGSECITTTTGGGTSCYVTQTVCNHYFLWIKYDSEITSLTIDCSNIK